MSKLTIDFSTLSQWRLCPQKFIYSAKHNLATNSSDAMDFGTLLHLGIELIGKADGLEHLSKILELVETEAHEKNYALLNLADDDRRSLKHAKELIAAYARHYENDVLRVQTYETQHTAYVGSIESLEIYYTGTLDGLTEDSVVEHKTTSYLGTNFIEMVNPNAQATGYLFLARDLLGDDNLNRVIFDGISTSGYGRSFGAKSSKPDNWTLYKEPSKLFLRIETTRDKDQIQAWIRRLMSDCVRIVEDLKALEVSRNEPYACYAYNTPCPFKQICSAPDAVAQMLQQNATRGEPWRGFKYEP